MIRALVCALSVCMAALPPSAVAETLMTSAGQIKIEKMVGGLDEPWSIGFLPDGAVLITERGGTLIRLADGHRHRVAGTPEVWDQGQGGLFDVLVPRDFAKTRHLFLSFAKSQPGGAGTAVARGTLSTDGTRLNDLTLLFETSPSGGRGVHFGGRLVEAMDGSLFLTVGDRGDRPQAQNTERHQGSVLRLARDGTAAPGTPTAGRPEIWSHGHRNPQGAALDRAGQLWVHEHGARGGDEINRVTRGTNYGWPIISYGTHYSGAKIGEGRRKEGMAQPELYWDPSIAPSGLAIYSGALWPEWTGDMFVGSLKFDYIARVSGDPLREVEQISSPATGRVRDVREAPDGSIWFLSVYEGAAFRLTR